MFILFSYVQVRQELTRGTNQLTITLSNKLPAFLTIEKPENTLAYFTSVPMTKKKFYDTDA